MEMFKRNRRILLITAMVILLSPLSILAYMYMNERAGGLADQRISKVWDTGKWNSNRDRSETD